MSPGSFVWLVRAIFLIVYGVRRGPGGPRDSRSPPHRRRPVAVPRGHHPVRRPGLPILAAGGNLGAEYTQFRHLIQYYAAGLHTIMPPLDETESRHRMSWQGRWRHPRRGRAGMLINE